MKEWVKKEEGVSFGETSEQQPTGYAAHSDHNSGCNPCVGEGVLLVVAQVLAGKAQQQEGGTRQGTEREAQRHLAHDGSLCHSQCVAAHSGNSVGDDRHNTVVVGVRVKQQAQRNAEQADDGAIKVPMLVGMMETRASVMEASIPEFLTTPVNAPAAKTMETIRNAACA